MGLLLLVLTAFSVNQGEALTVRIPERAGVQSIELRWQDKSVPVVRVGQEWWTVLGVDLDVAAGNYTVPVLFKMDGGRIEQDEIVVEVRAGSFPTTELKVEERFVELNPKDQRRSAREAEEINRIYAKWTPEILWTDPFRSPIEGLKGSNFGHRRIFNGQPRSPHAGADLRAQTGTPIYSTNRGRVALAKSLFFTGNTVIVDHGLGIFSLYAHLSRIDVKPGATLQRGQLVGLAGATGRATGPHLHWGVRIQGARVDPFSLITMSANPR